VGTGSSDDYYALLGVDAGVGEVDLRRAWRQLALRWHPDRAGLAATALFQKLLDAYGVLSDPAARAAYDRRRGASTPGARVPPSAKPPAARAQAPGVMLPRQSGPLNALLARGIARRAGDHVIELLFSAQEVATGGMVGISMRVPVSCPACAPDATGACARCEAKRTVDEPFSAWLAVPPGVAEGTLLIPSALLNGMIRPVSFRVRLDGSR
jgi:DnaJ-class molecular chaperone